MTTRCKQPRNLRLQFCTVFDNGPEHLTLRGSRTRRDGTTEYVDVTFEGVTAYGWAYLVGKIRGAYEQLRQRVQVFHSALVDASA
jgi:hypothetical protein